MVVETVFGNRVPYPGLIGVASWGSLGGGSALVGVVVVTGARVFPLHAALCQCFLAKRVTQQT